MANMKRSYLNHITDMEGDYYERCLKKCIELGKPELWNQTVFDNSGIVLDSKKEISFIASSAISNVDKTGIEIEVDKFCSDLVMSNKLNASIDDVCSAQLKQEIIQEFRYSDSVLWIFIYETREFEFPNGTKWCISIHHAVPPTSPFSGLRYPILYKLIDSEGNEKIIDTAVNNLFSNAGIEPDTTWTWKSLEHNHQQEEE